MITIQYRSPINGTVEFVISHHNDLFRVHCTNGVMSDGRNYWSALHLSSAMKMVEEHIQDLINEDDYMMKVGIASHGRKR